MSEADKVTRSQDRFEVLDALRGICALVVAVYHFKSDGLISSLPLVQNGWLFVDYFFVLSGFVIAHSYGERIGSGSVSIGHYMALRIGRIYPLHIAVLLGFIALELVLFALGDVLANYVSREPFTGSRSATSLVQNVLLLQSFGIEGAAGWNGPAWSIAAEMWTYLLFAFVFLAGKRTMLLISAALGAMCLVWMTSYAHDLHITFEGGILRCVFGFSVGVLTYHAFRRFGGVGGSLAELAVLLMVISFVSLSSGLATFAAPFVFAMMVFVLASQRGVVAKLLSLRLFQFLGMISYSIYMVHVFVQGRLGEVFQITDVTELRVDAEGRTILLGSPLMSDFLTIVMVLLVILASWITYSLVERPGRNWSRKWFARGQRTAHTAKG